MGELSGFEVLTLAKEVNLALRGAYVNNIFTIGPSQLFRFRKPGGEDVWVVVSPTAGLWVSAQVSERGETSEFTSKLRAELERARFVGAGQYGLDRVFYIDFEGREKRRLVLELMPPGNIVVTDGEGRATLTLRDYRSDTRTVRRGAVYSPPDQRRVSPDAVTPEGVSGMTSREKTAGRAVGRSVALPRKYVAEALTRLGLQDSSPSSALAGREGELVAVLARMVEQARESPEPCVCDTEKGEDLFAFPPRGLVVKRGGKTMSELCDQVLLKQATEEAREPTPEEGKRRELETTIARLKEEAGALEVRAGEAKKAAAEARSASIEEGTAAMKKLGAKPGREPTSSAAVSSALYDHAKALLQKSSQDLESARKLEKRLSKVTVVAPSRTKAIPRKRREWFEKFRWFHTSAGKLAIGGRDAQTNSILLSRHLDDNDTVYHADLFGSPFFVLKGGGAQTPEEVNEVAQATVAFSSAWKTGLGAADAYWVEPGQVSSSAPSGEYLARGSFAIRGKKNFVNKVIVEVSVALDPQGRVVAAPEDSLKGRVSGYVVLRPHNEKGSDTAKKVAKELGADAIPPPLDDVQRALPAGGGKIVRRG